jgi:glycosyltransferase involved in cell wall biosynthesis
MNPLMHYIEHGAPAGLDPSPKFRTRAYMREHPGLAETGINPLYHFHRSVRRRGDERHDGGARIAASRQRPALPDWAVYPAEPLEEVSPEAVESARRQLAAKPLTVSVVVPTYNRAGKLRRALRSTFDQSYPPLEVIVSDDGSTDETEGMLRSEYQPELETGLLRYLPNEHRRGPSAARNAGLRAARGDLIAYLDSDNAWEEHFLLLMTAKLAERDDACTVYCGYRLRRDGEDAAQECFDWYDRAQLLARNYLDLNTFVHRRRIFEQLGGFDESMTRLVDWELILRYTRPYPPSAVPFYLVDYYAGEAGGRVTHTESFDQNAASVRRRFAHERIYSGITPLRIGYVLWDFPSLSQTFVLSEIRRLIELGYDVHVYYHAAPDRAAQLDFEVPSFRVDDADALAELLVAHERTTLHSHFAYPAVARLTYPAALRTGIPFTFMVHAVDIFHRANVERNRIAEVTHDELCLHVFGAGRYHRSFLIEQGVPVSKIAIARQASRRASAAPDAIARRLRRRRRVVVCIARFVEKKGVDDLIRAAALLGDRVDVRIYGYGPLEDSYRRLAQEIGATSVCFAGALEGTAATAAALEEADVFALPCVVDSDGDMDGLPTVLGEAMAAGVPVVTTDVSSIPEIVVDGVTGFVVPRRDPEALANRLVEVIEMDDALLRPVIGNAQRVASNRWSVETIVEALLDAWERPPIEIAMVTYSRDEEGAAATTGEIIRRIYEMTTTEFSLTVIDNGSDAAFVNALQKAIRGRANAALALRDDNAYWGPAVNLAFTNARSEFLLYVCSREGFVLTPGWEREYLDHLRAHRDVALAGHPVSSPAFPTGRAYQRQPWFSGFRNQRFAERNLDREFFHVQGGLFALRRAAFNQCGGFSEVVSQDAVDVEFSYVVESHGWKLGKVTTIPSVTTKTRPRIHAHVDENTVAAHPLSLESVDLASRVTSGRFSFCNVCSWSGDSFVADGAATDACPACGSTPFGRLLYRYLASSALPYRGLDCAAVLEDESVVAELERMFALTRLNSERLDRELGSRDIVIADLPALPGEHSLGTVEAIVGATGNRGIAIFGRPLTAEHNGDTVTAHLAGTDAHRVSIASRAVRFDPGGLLVVSPQGAQRAPDIRGLRVPVG